MTKLFCWLTQKRLGTYQDGELGPAARAKTVAHLTRCPTCAAEARSLGGLRAELRGAAIPEPPEPVWDAFWPQVRARLAAGPEAEPLPRRSWTWLTGHPRLAFGSAAAAVAMAVLAIVGPWAPRSQAPIVTPPAPTAPAPGSSTAGSPTPTPASQVVVQAVETADPNSSVMVFTHEDPGVTVVWVFGLERTL